MNKLFFFFAALCVSQLSLGMENAQADLNKQLNNAIIRGTVDEVAELISRGADVNAYDSYSGETLFGQVVFRYRPELFSLFLAVGANPNIRCRVHGAAPLSDLAGRCKDIQEIELFLQYGANPNDTLQSGRTVAAAGIASAQGDIDRARLVRQTQRMTSEREANIRERIELRNKIIDLLSDPERIRAVILREDNPNPAMKPWRKTDKNIFNAIMNREMGGK